MENLEDGLLPKLTLAINPRLFYLIAVNAKAFVAFNSIEEKSRRYKKSLLFFILK